MCTCTRRRTLQWLQSLTIPSTCLGELWGQSTWITHTVVWVDHADTHVQWTFNTMLYKGYPRTRNSDLVRIINVPSSCKYVSKQLKYGKAIAWGTNPHPIKSLLLLCPQCTCTISLYLRYMYMYHMLPCLHSSLTIITPTLYYLEVTFAVLHSGLGGVSAPLS